MLKFLAVAAVAATALASAAHAATVGQNFTVSATVAQSCAIASLPNYDFGTIGGTASTIQNFTPTTVTINCSNGTPYTVTLSSATGGGSTGFRMTNGANPMEYALYANSFGNPQWTGTANASTSFVGTGANANINMYGTIPVQTAPVGGWPAGNYVDTVTMTVTY